MVNVVQLSIKQIEKSELPQNLNVARNGGWGGEGKLGELEEKKKRVEEIGYARQEVL